MTEAWGMDIKPSPQNKQPWVALKEPKQEGMSVFGGVHIGNCSTATECCDTQDLEKTPCRAGWVIRQSLPVGVDSQEPSQGCI